MKCRLCNKEIRSGEPIVVDPYTGDVYCDPLCAKNDFFGGVESPCITLESVMSGYGLKWITKNHPDYHCYETGDFSNMQKENTRGSQILNKTLNSNREGMTDE